MQGRTTKEECFLNQAEECAKRGTCQRRNYGAVLVDKEGAVVSTGYSGAPKGQTHCSEYGECWRDKNKIPSGGNYNKCRSVHAEMNALLQAGKEARGSTIYISGIDVKSGEIVAAHPCFLCSKMLVNAGVERIVIRIPGDEALSLDPVESFKKIEEKELGKLVPVVAG